MRRYRNLSRIVLMVGLLVTGCGQSGGGGDGAGNGGGSNATLVSIAVTPRDAAVRRETTRPFTAVGSYSDGSMQDVTAQASWGSSDTAVATVNASGGVSGVGIGATVITASVGAVSGSTALTVSATALPRTGQTTCYAANGTVIECAGTGQDGDRGSGVAWPGVRFLLHFDPLTAETCVVDTLTGLEWTQAPDSTLRNWNGVSPPGALPFSATFSPHCAGGGWRVPNRRELRSLVHYGETNTAAWLNTQGFLNIPSTTDAIAWTATSYANDTGSAWTQYLADGVSVWNGKGNVYYVWLVRTVNTTTAMAQPARTGQTTKYADWDDGDPRTQAGVAWPDPRFTNLDGSVPLSGDVVVDRLTGLMWTRDGYAPGPPACTPAAERGWQQALDFIACLNANAYLGYSDWRLPNALEMESLANVGVMNSGAWLGSIGFINGGRSDFPYWSSTTVASRTDYVWTVSLYNSAMATSAKANSFNVWPVRGGP